MNANDMGSTILRYLEVPHPAGEPRPTALINHDIKPIEKERRVWDTKAFFSLWAVTAFNMSNFAIGSSMLSLGLNWWQAIITTAFGHILGSAIVVVVSFPGTQYHISFPIATRIAWGYVGSAFVVLNRIVLSVLWTGIQSWLGGLVTYVCLRAIWPSIDKIHNTIPSSSGTTLPEFIGFIVFFLIQFPFLYLSPKNVRWLVIFGSSIGFLVQFVLVCWSCATKGSAGFGTVLSNEVVLHGSTLGWMCVFSICLTMSSITSGTLSICDYTRFAKSTRSATYSQFGGWFACWLSNIFGILTIAATQNRYGAQLWNAAGLLIVMQDDNPSSRTRAAVFFAGAGLIVSQISLNVAGNTFSGGTDMSALFPRWINIRRGQVITALLGVAINPWYLLASATVFLTVMSSYSTLLQPCLGILCAQYFVVQRQRLMIADLYVLGSKGIYWYTFGVNWRAVVTWLVCVAIHLPGFVNAANPSIKIDAGSQHLYYMNPVTGFVLGFILTAVLHRVFPVEKQTDFVGSVSRKEAMNIYAYNGIDPALDEVVEVQVHAKI